MQTTPTMKTLTVDDLPSELRDACIQRGHSPHAEITPREALAEWCGWHIGDRVWASMILDLHEQAVALTK